MVYNEEPQEIAFKTVENVMTKGGAGASLGNWKDGSMGVFAYKENSSDIYLENKKFTKYQSENYWAGKGTSYYWPFQGSLNMLLLSKKQTFPSLIQVTLHLASVQSLL